MFVLLSVLLFRNKQAVRASGVIKEMFSTTIDIIVIIVLSQV